MPVVFDEQLQMIEGMFKDLYDDEDSTEESNVKEDVVTQKIKKESKKVLKSVKKTDDEMEAQESLVTLDDCVFADPLDEKNEIL